MAAGRNTGSTHLVAAKAADSDLDLDERTRVLRHAGQVLAAPLGCAPERGGLIARRRRGPVGRDAQPLATSVDRVPNDFQAPGAIVDPAQAAGVSGGCASDDRVGFDDVDPTERAMYDTIRRLQEQVTPHCWHWGLAPSSPVARVATSSPVALGMLTEALTGPPGSNR